MTHDRGDISSESPFLDASIDLDIAGVESRFSRLEWSEKVALDDEEILVPLHRQILDTERLRDRARNLLRALKPSQSLPDSDFHAPAKSKLKRSASEHGTPSLVVFFSTNPSVLSASRSWYMSHFADWMRAQVALAPESSSAEGHFTAMQAAATRFLPECSEPDTGDESGSASTINEDADVQEVPQLSDSERGILSFALDLARRLSQANPTLTDPLSEGRATVLIDDIDLHPKWQLQIVQNLAAAFPRCQFIPTTHSPKVIGEVPHERIQMIVDGQVYSPSHSFGVDPSRVLEEVMEADPRAKEVSQLVTEISQAFGTRDFNRGRELLGKLVDQLGEAGPEVTRLRTLLDFVEERQ